MGSSMSHPDSNATPAWPPPSSLPTSPPGFQTPPPPPSARRRRRRLPWILAAVVVVIALVATGVVLLVGGDSRFVFGTLTIDRGTVEVRSEPEGEFVALASGDGARLGDTFRTSEDARATLELADGSLLRLGGAASAAFEGSTEDSWVVRLLEGDAWYRHTADSGEAVIGVAAKEASIGNGIGVAAIGCDADGDCSLQAVAGAIDLIPAGGDEVALVPGERAVVDAGGTLTEVGVVAEDDQTPWVTENREADRAAGLEELPTPADRAGALAGARVEGSWAFTLTVTESTADNFEVGDRPVFDMELAPTCPEGPCDFAATFDRYAGTGTQADDGTVSFTVAAPLQCVNTSSGAVTVPDNGPESLAFTLTTTAAEVRDGLLVVTALAGTARYEKDVRGPCRPGDQVGSYFAAMTVTGALA